MTGRPRVPNNIVENMKPKIVFTVLLLLHLSMDCIKNSALCWVRVPPTINIKNSENWRCERGRRRPLILHSWMVISFWPLFYFYFFSYSKKGGFQLPPTFLDRPIEFTNKDILLGKNGRKKDRVEWDHIWIFICAYITCYRFFFINARHLWNYLWCLSF